MTSDLPKLATQQGDRWRHNPYYDNAESRMKNQWDALIWPLIQRADFDTVVDLAAGHGRNSELLLPLCRKLYIVDINEENTEYCRTRFKGRDDKITYLTNDGVSLRDIGNDSISLLYCFDAMVHFDSDVIRNYLREFRRILKQGAHGFCHHSNSTVDHGGFNLKAHVRGRNFMSQDMFQHYCVKEGLKPIDSKLISWSGEKDLDCLTLFQKL